MSTNQSNRGLASQARTKALSDMITNNTLNPAWKTILRVRANEFAIPAKLLMRVLLEIEASRGILRAELIRED